MSKTLFYLLMLALALGTPGCARKDALDDIEHSGKLRVVSRNSPTTYYLDKNGPAGFEYELAQRLARELKVELKIEPAFSLQEIFDRLTRHEAHIAAAGLTRTESRAALYPHTLAYDTLVTQVVYRAGKFRPRQVEELLGMRIVTLANSSHAQVLQELQQSALPELEWEELSEGDTMELLERVDSGEAELALIDSSEFEVQQSLYPRLKVAFDLTEEQDMVWYLPPGPEYSGLLERINTFIAQLKATGELARLRELHFGHTEGFSRISSHTFTRKMRSALPRYEALIKRVAKEYQLDWQLLAAIAYQESHWNPRAQSPTGVRGMMMLTLPTARELGVDNRLDAEQSLRGGARYYKNMKRRLPPDIKEPDRTWMALAAYNIGMGHLEDARILTERDGSDPHLWSEVMQRLPLLQKSAHYKTTRYGYARGREAVTYVQNIRHYYNILQWQDISQQQALPPVEASDHLPARLGEVSLKAL